MDINYLELLPDEILLKILLETDDLKTLSKWCQTSRRVNRICQDEGFWHNKYRKDFGFISRGGWDLRGLRGLSSRMGDLSGEYKLMEGETWREQYKQRASFGKNSPISAGTNNYCIVDRKGILYMGGERYSGKHPPRVIYIKEKIIGISCSDEYTAALTGDGKIYLLGYLGHLVGIDEFITGGIERNEYNQIKNINYPLLFNLPYPAIKIHAGRKNLGIITSDQTPYFTGYTKPINIKAIDITSTKEKYAIIGTDRKLYMWDLKIDLSQKVTYFKDYLAEKDIDRPEHVFVPEPVEQMSFYSTHYMVLSVSGNVYVWGTNYLGESGISFLGKLDVPTKLDLPNPISFISTKHQTSAALTSGGKLYMWGDNDSGKILNEDHIPDWVKYTHDEDARHNYFSHPIQISIEGKLINYVEVGPTYTLAVTDDGVVNYWGNPGKAPYEFKI